MEIQLLTQPTLNSGEAFSLGEAITTILTSKRPKYKTANFIFGVIKPNAIEYLKPYLKEFIDNNGTVNFYLDSNKRITSNNLISELINIGCNIYVFSSEDSITEFQYRGCFFESAKKADVFLTSGNLSMNGLFDSFNIVTHLIYDNLDEFNQFHEKILSPSLLENFSKVDTLIESDWTSVKTSEINIPTISEFTKKTTIDKSSKTVDLSDSGILIEIDDSVEFSVPVEIPKEPKKTEPKIIQDNWYCM